MLRTVPGPARRRVPLRLRTSMAAIIAFLVVAGAVFAAVLIFAADRAERGTGDGRSQQPAQQESGGRLEPVSLGQTAAEDYDPLGGDGEHSEETARVLDRDESTSWSTESYQDGLSKDGVGIVVDAKPGVAAATVRVTSETPGYTATIYAAKGGPPESVPGGWTQIAGSREFGASEDVQVDTAGQRFRYYLVWITELPSDSEKVEISEIRLYTRGS